MDGYSAFNTPGSWSWMILLLSSLSGWFPLLSYPWVCSRLLRLRRSEPQKSIVESTIHSLFFDKHFNISDRRCDNQRNSLQQNLRCHNGGHPNIELGIKVLYVFLSPVEGKELYIPLFNVSNGNVSWLFRFEDSKESALRHPSSMESNGHVSRALVTTPTVEGLETCAWVQI